MDATAPALRFGLTAIAMVVLVVAGLLLIVGLLMFVSLPFGGTDNGNLTVGEIVRAEVVYGAPAILLLGGAGYCAVEAIERLRWRWLAWAGLLLAAGAPLGAVFFFFGYFPTTVT